MELWTIILSKLSTEDKLSCRCVCKSLKKEVVSILNKNQDRLWLKHRKDNYEYYICYDKGHRIFSRDTLAFRKTISIKNLQFVSKLMPSIKILQLDPLDQAYRENYNVYDEYSEDIDGPDYRDKKGIAVPITRIFPQVACLILPGRTENNNFVGDLSQVKHLTLFDGVYEESPTFLNLDSLEARMCSHYYDKYLPMSSKRFVVPYATIEWRSLPKTLEVIKTKLNYDEYLSVGKPHFSKLKILKGPYEQKYNENQNLETLINFLKDHKGSLTELCFSALEEAEKIKVLLPLLTQLQKLSLEIKTDKQAIELKEVKALAYNLQYFKLLFYFRSATKQHLGPILENLPTGLDNLSIKGVRNYEEIDTFMEKIMEKVVNSDTKRVTIAGVEDTKIIEKIVKMKPEAVTVEKRNKVFEEDHSDCTSQIRYFKFIYNIIISL